MTCLVCLLAVCWDERFHLHWRWSTSSRFFSKGDRNDTCWWSTNNNVW